MERAGYAQGRRGVKRAIIASRMEKEMEAGIERERELPHFTCNKGECF